MTLNKDKTHIGIIQFFRITLFFLFFLGFIIYDTQMIMTRVIPEDYIIATIQLYLDIINLFIEILKIMEKVNRK